MEKVRPKKSLGQHFLVDKNIARKIVNSLDAGSSHILEVGPGMGVLTGFLMERPGIELKAIETDIEAVNYLTDHFPSLNSGILHQDFLKVRLSEIFTYPFSLIGNFPYNISSQIFFRILEYKDQIPEVVCMIQKEVAERINAREGNKTYGILSVLLQSFYNIQYLFTVSKKVFNPPPKVKSAVIKLTRNKRVSLPVEEDFFFKVVKTGFSQRRKTLRNALKTLLPEPNFQHPVLKKRAEELNPEAFIELARLLSKHL